MPLGNRAPNFSYEKSRKYVRSFWRSALKYCVLGKSPEFIYGDATTSEVVNQKNLSVRDLPLAFNKDGAFVPPFSGTDISKVNKQAFADQSYPITRKLYAIIKKDGGRDEQAGTAYANFLLSVEGQKLVEESGFAPIRTLKSK